MFMLSNRLFLLKKMTRQLCWRVALVVLLSQAAVTANATETAAITNSIPPPLILQIAAPSDRSQPTGTFRTIREALDALPTLAPDPNRWVVLQLATGTYREKVFLVRDKVVLVGVGLDQTLLLYPELRLLFLKRQAGSAAVSGSAGRRAGRWGDPGAAADAAAAGGAFEGFRQ